MSATDTSALPDYAPVPRSALGPALNEQGYYVGRVERNLYWVTDGTYQAAFLTTSDGVVLMDNLGFTASHIGHKIEGTETNHVMTNPRWDLKSNLIRLSAPAHRWFAFGSSSLHHGIPSSSTRRAQRAGVSDSTMLPVQTRPSQSDDRAVDLPRGSGPPHRNSLPKA